jgi:hypothetical protein
MRPVPKHLEVLELESWRHRTRDQRVRPQSPGGLPGVRDYDMNRVGPAKAGPHVQGRIHSTQNSSSHSLKLVVRSQQFEWIAFAVVPRLIGRHAVPSAHLFRHEQKADGCERASFGTMADGLDA